MKLPDVRAVDPDLQDELERAVDVVLASAPTAPEKTKATASEPGRRRQLPETAPRLLALAGHPRAGKDYVAAYLQRSYAGVERLAYSTPMIAEVNAFLAPHGHVIGEANKPLPHYRHLIQAWALARRVERPDYWTSKLEGALDAAMKRSRLTVISGARLPSDLEPIEARGGELWRIVRPKNPYRADHAVESQIDSLPAMCILVNATEGDMTALEEAVEQALRRPRA